MKKYFGEKQMKLIGILSITLLLAFAAGCSDDENRNESVKTEKLSEAEGQNKNEEHSEVIVLTEKAMREFDIEVKVAGPGVIKTHIDLTGEIIAEPSRISHIIPRFNGIVKEVYKTVGDKVSKGEKLALIESNESLTIYEVQSLISGTIIEMHMTQGELIGNEAHAFTIADLNKVWATFNIYQKDLGKIRVGQRALVSVGSMDIEEIGTISYVSPILDEKTRTATARVILNNQTGKWLPGMFVTAKVDVSEKRYPVVIEKTALQTLEEQVVVFIKDKNGFKPKAVRIGNENDDYVEIISGLNAGDQYVSKNSFILKAEILKESFGGDEH
jgi:cobalt-zinc-cadmium efflux system membrane fusion protein